MVTVSVIASTAARTVCLGSGRLLAGAGAAGLSPPAQHREGKRRGKGGSQDDRKPDPHAGVSAGARQFGSDRIYPRSRAGGPASAVAAAGCPRATPVARARIPTCAPGIPTCAPGDVRSGTAKVGSSSGRETGRATTGRALRVQRPDDRRTDGGSITSASTDIAPTVTTGRWVVPAGPGDALRVLVDAGVARRHLMVGAMACTRVGGECQHDTHRNHCRDLAHHTQIRKRRTLPDRYRPIRIDREPALLRGGPEASVASARGSAGRLRHSGR
jgi:hypothetical protein